MAAKELGIRIPHDLSVIAFDRMEWLDFLSPPITSIAQPVDEMGRAAAELMIERIKVDNGLVKEVRLPVTLIERESVWPVSVQAGAVR